MKENNISHIKNNNTTKLTQDNIPRCPNCNLICSLQLIIEKGKTNINYQCENGHEGIISLKQYLNIYNKYSLSKEKCKECGKTKKEIKQDIFYCSNCSIFICNLCQSNHLKKENHNIININRYDALCKIHSNLYTWFCINCNKNLCAFCKNEHKNHNLIDLSEYTFSNELKIKIENEIKNLDEKLNNLKRIKKHFNLIIDNFKKSSKLEMKFIKFLLWTYEFEDKHKNLNFHVVQNLKELEMMNQNKNDFFDKLFEEGNKFLSFLSNIEIDENNLEYTFSDNQIQSNINFQNQKNINTLNNRGDNLKNSILLSNQNVQYPNLEDINLKNTILIPNITQNSNLQNLNPHNIILSNNTNFQNINLSHNNILQNSITKEISNNQNKEIEENKINEDSKKTKEEYPKNIKIIKSHKAIINYLDTLKDGRLVSCSDDHTLIIYKLETFDIQISIKEHTDYVRSFTELHNGKIITCSKDKTMKIIKLIGENNYQIEQTLKDHYDSVYKIIEIRKNQLISISWDKTMKIWELNNENRFECVKTIIFQKSHSNCNILKLNEKEFVTSSCVDKNLKFWDSEDFTRIKTINNIETAWTLKNLCLINDNILCVGGVNCKGFYIINILSHKIIKIIIGIKTVFSINKCLDGLFLCSIEDEDNSNCLVKYNYNSQKFKIVICKENAHQEEIYSCVELKNGIVVSGGKDGLIKLWIWGNE